MDDIRTAIEDLAAELGGRVAFAAERGSRAFGTDADGSDHDTVLYLSFPVREHLGIRVLPDRYGTRNRGDNTLVTFHVRRSLLDAIRGNVTVWTVTNSLLVHDDGAGLRERLVDLCLRCHNDRSALFQYANFTRQAVTRSRRPGCSTPKVFLNVLQPLLSFRFVRSRSAPAPVPFEELLAASPYPALVEASRVALELKRAGATDFPGALAATVMDEAAAVMDESRSLVDEERSLEPWMVEEADSILSEVTMGMDPEFARHASTAPARGSRP